MEIANGIGYQTNNYVDNMTGKPLSETDNRRSQEIGTDSSRSRDVVNLSQASKDYQVAQKAVQETAEIRTDEVAVIKREIAENTYEIDYNKIAKKIVGSMIDELA